MRGIEPRFARRSVPKKEMKANRDSHYTTSDYLLIWNRLAFLYWLYYYGFLNFLKQVFFLLQCKTYLIRSLFGFKK